MATAAVSPHVRAALETMQGTLRGRLDGAYQHEGVRWMLQRELGELGGTPRGGFLADDMGLGKTNQMIATMCGNRVPTLVVTEVATLHQWRDTLIDFGGLRPAVLTASFSMPTLPPDIDVVLTTYSVFQRAGGCPACLHSFAWGRIVLDEGHRISNPKTRLYQELSRLTGSVRWILTATPIMNGEKDMIAQATWLGLPPSVAAIRDAYLLRRTQQQQGLRCPMSQLPKLESSVVRLAFKHPYERALYEAVEQQYAELIAQASATTRAQALTLDGILRCRQICAHPSIYHDSVAKSRLVQPVEIAGGGSSSSSKVDYVVDYIKRLRKDEKCLVFCSMTAEIRLLQEALNAERLPCLMFDGSCSREDRETVLHNFKQMPVRALLVSIKCGSVGLNLQCAQHVLITTPNWNPTVDLQAMGRAHRKGQTQVVTCVRLVMEGTIEERCLEISQQKLDVIAEAMHDDTMSSRMGAAVVLTAQEMRHMFTGKMLGKTRGCKRSADEAM